MGRLFWKFFGFIWLAQLAGIVAIGATFWFAARHFERGNDIDVGPAAGASVETAAIILRYAGKPAFADWVQKERREKVFAVDAAGRDLLSRELAPGLLEHARQMHLQAPESGMATEVTDASGHRYLLFAAGRDMMRAVGIRDGGMLRGLPPLPPTIATLLASLLTAVLLAWYVAKPIRSLRFAFGAMSSGNLALRVGPSIGARHDELADLGHDFDRMAERLQSSMEGQRRLLHDVSHEVRSPLARLQAAVGLLRQKYDREDATIERIEEEITRIDRLVGDLLKLSRIEAGELVEREQDVDLRELVFEIVMDANFEAQATGRTVRWLDETSATTSGWPEMLRGAVENIVRNALKHAPNSDVVVIETTLVAAPPRYVIRVLDAGPGVPEEELNVLFTPFYRSALGSSTDGYGLGLAIARRSVETHGGTIRARNRAGGGLMVEITLPLRGPAGEPRAQGQVPSGGEERRGGSGTGVLLAARAGRQRRR